MARTNVPITNITRAGDDPEVSETIPDETDDAMFQNDGNTFLWARNTGVGSHIVTVQTPQMIAGLAVAEMTVTIPAAGKRLIGPFPTETFNQQSGADVGKVYVDVDGTGIEMRYKAYRM